MSLKGSSILQYSAFAITIESLKFTVFPTMFLGTDLFKEVNLSHVNIIFLNLLNILRGKGDKVNG